MNKNLTSSQPAIRVYLGGSFNPVHKAHIEMAMHVYDTLAPIAIEKDYKLQVSLLPNARSPFKSETTHPKHRLNMLKLAVQDTPLLIDELELWQTPPVYTIDSVRTLRQRYPNDILIFMMGMDSARSLEHWKQGLQLTDYVNLWLFDRSDDTKRTADERAASKIKDDTAKSSSQLTIVDLAKLTDELPVALQSQVTRSVTQLLELPKLLLGNQDSSALPLKITLKGRIYIDTQSIAMISSTDIREQLFQKIPHTQNQTTTDAKLAIMPNFLLKTLNPAVYRYIIAHQLYSAA